MNKFFQPILVQIFQWPPTVTTVIGALLLIFAVDYALFGNFVWAVAVAGGFATLCPERAGLVAKVEQAIGSSPAARLRMLAPFALMLGLGAAAALGACSKTQPEADINALLGSSAASTALTYVAALDPTIGAYLDDADTAIAANAPKVLSDTCGAISMGAEILSTIETIDPTLIAAATQQALAASIAAAQPLCPPNAAPANVAQAANEALTLYAALEKAWTGAGVSLPAAPAAS